MSARDRRSARRPRMMDAASKAADETLKSEAVRIERKSFVFVLRENARGRYLRITEDVSGRRDTIIVPATGLQDFKRMVDEMTKHSAETPEKGKIQPSAVG